MKRSLLIAAALSFSLIGLSACGTSQSQQTPVSLPESAPVQTETIPQPSEVPAAMPETSSATDLPAPPAAEIPAEPEEPAQPPFAIPNGIWLARTDAGYTNYYEFGPGSMVSCSLDYGILHRFTYDGDGKALTFRMDPSGSPYPATVEVVSEEELILHWEGLLPEKLSFVADATFADFPFYSNQDLGDMALEYYEKTSGHSPEELDGLVSGTMTNEDNTVTVQLYENLGDHNSTAAWYLVDRFTGTGTNLLNGLPIDLLASTAPEEEDPGDSGLPAEGEPPAAEDVRYDVSEPERVAALIELFLSDPETVETHGGERLVDWLTNSTHGFTVLYGEPYFSFQGEWTVGWYAKAIDAGSFCPITIPGHLLEDVLAICKGTA